MADGVYPYGAAIPGRDMSRPYLFELSAFRRPKSRRSR
jgi:hypothetical protein